MDVIEKAFALTPRANFVPEYLSGEVDIDAPLPIGFGQTISQPTTVQWMLEWLEPQAGDKVLDVGSGSGWTTALLAQLVGPAGYVHGVEIVSGLMEFGRDNCQRLHLKNVSFHLAGKNPGLPKYAPYDCILVSAAASKLPQQLLDQLKPGGKMVIPVNNDILEITKTSEKDHETITHPGFVFVPLV